jgi:hypothetical protein
VVVVAGKRRHVGVVFGRGLVRVDGSAHSSRACVVGVMEPGRLLRDPQVGLTTDNTPVPVRWRSCRL